MFFRRTSKPTLHRAVWRGWTEHGLGLFLDRKTERLARVRTLVITSIELHALSVGKGEDPAGARREVELTGYMGEWMSQRVPVSGRIGIGSRENDCGWIFLGALEKDKENGNPRFEPQLNFYLAVANDSQLARLEELILVALGTRTAEVWINVRMDYTGTLIPSLKEFLLADERPDSLEYTIEWFHLGIKAGRNALGQD